MICINQYNFDPNASYNFEVNDGVSETIPDQTVPLAELLEKYSRGGEVVTFNPVFAEDDDELLSGVDIEKLRPMERLELAEQLGRSIVEERARITNKKRKTKDDKMVLSEIPEKLVKSIATFLENTPLKDKDDASAE